MSDDCLTGFMQRWEKSSGNERGNYQLFLSEFCDALGVDRPGPKGSIAGDPYCFDRDVKIFHPSGKETSGFIDLYKQDCFILEAKQGGVSGGKVGTAKRGTQAYRKAMQAAFNQAVAYARTFKNRPPFLITCDIGESFQVWSDFGAASELDYGSYDARQEIAFADLKKPEILALFVDIFSDPQKRNPEKIAAQVTREVAADLAELAKSLEAAGHAPKEVADFLMRCIFTMFAEDIGLLTVRDLSGVPTAEKLLTENLERWQGQPLKFVRGIEALWTAMNAGQPFWDYGRLLKFNGGLFEKVSAIALDGEQLGVLLQAAKRDWQKVEPAIFGTLLERALESRERSKLGAHYTPRAYVERLVRPVVLEPLRERWRLVQMAVDEVLGETASGHQGGLVLGAVHDTQFEGKQEVSLPNVVGSEPTKGQRDRAILELENFLKELREIKILDPACGTGNFLYVTMDLMKELESEVLVRLAEVSGRDQLRLDFEQINPQQFLGIEINPRAAAIADLVVWIGYLQWHFRRFGNVPPIEPVLRAYHNIECRDAVLAYDGVEPDVDPKTGVVRTRWGGKTMVHPVTGKEVPDPSDQKEIYRYLNPRPAEWPKADYIVSNPPFLGNSRMREVLGDGYAETLRKIYKDVPETVDFVMYWWHKSALQIRFNNLFSFGLITTNTISQKWQRSVIQKQLDANKNLVIFYAIPDHPWSDAGAAVRISMTGVKTSHSSYLCQYGVIEFESEKTIPEDSAESLVLKWNLVEKISSNLRSDIDVSQVKSMVGNKELANRGMQLIGSGFCVTESEKRNIEIEVALPYLNGRDLMQNPRNAFVLDFFGLDESQVASLYPKAYQWILERVKPERDQNNRDSYRKKWWIFGEPRTKLRDALRGICRYVATVETAKHRIFVFLDKQVVPDNMLIAIALEDAYFLGVLSSTIHVTWALAAGGTLEDRPRYNKTVCFDPFPFPDPNDRLKQEIRELGDRLDTHRKTVQTNHPDITITGMYNLLEKLRTGQILTDKERQFNDRALVSTLKQIHDDLDRAVFRAYGWDDLIPPWETRADTLDEAILERLVTLNAQRAEEERNGHIRWLRPDYQAPSQTTPQTSQTDLAIAPAPTPEPKTAPQPLPKAFKERIAAVRDLLRSQGGEWTIDRAASQFSGKNTKAKRQAIGQTLEALEGAGLLLSYTDETTQETHWYDATLQAIA